MGDHVLFFAFHRHVQKKYWRYRKFLLQTFGNTIEIFKSP
jgi:hypothetical protein